MPRLPAPPLPRVLKPKPARPGEESGDQHPVIEGGLTVVDWLDERTSLSGGIRWMLFRKVPRGISFSKSPAATMYSSLRLSCCARLNVHWLTLASRNSGG